MARLTRSQLLSGAAASFVCAPAIVRAQSAPKIRVVGVATDDTTPIFYAIQNGLYSKAGLEVEFVPLSSGSAATAAVVSGAYEIAKASPVASMQAYLRGLPLVVISNASIYNPKSPPNVAVVAPDSPFKTGADLIGKTASSPGLFDLNGVAIASWVDKNGGDSKSMKWVELPNSAAAAALREHRVDVANIDEPQLSDAVATGRVRVLAPSFNAIGDRFDVAVYLANSEWAAKNNAAVKKWVAVTLQAGAYTNGHHAETVAMMSDVTKIPPDVFSRMARFEAATAATADPGYLQPLIDAAAKYKAIPRGFTAKEIFAPGLP